VGGGRGVKLHSHVKEKASRSHFPKKAKNEMGLENGQELVDKKNQGALLLQGKKEPSRNGFRKK